MDLHIKNIPNNTIRHSKIAMYHIDPHLGGKTFLGFRLPFTIYHLLFSIYYLLFT